MLKRLKWILAQHLCKDDAPAPQGNGGGDGGMLGKSMRRNVEHFRQKLGNSSDVVVREFVIGEGREENAALLFIEGITNSEILDNAILKPLMFDNRMLEYMGEPDGANLEAIGKMLLAECNVTLIADENKMMTELLSGGALFFAEGSAKALIISTKQWDRRGIEEPSTETVVRGPRQSFTETIRTNTAMLRRIIKNPNLRFEAMKLGEKTGTDVCIVYVEGTVKPDLVAEIKRRLGQMNSEVVLESGYIEAFIEDTPHSLFSTINSSERPDAVARLLLEGRAAILVDGTPFALTVPMLFVDSFKSAEDYYVKAYFADAMRVIRMVSYIITILAPPLYVALTVFHQELIPTKLLFTMIAGHEGIPFPSLMEAFLMMFLFDILKEAGVRLPKAIGSAVSIVGALVLGEAAVTAGLIGPFMVIVVAITAITSFAIPSQMNTTLVLRYFILFYAGFLGIFGILMGSLIVIFHLVSLESFGVAYLSASPTNSREGIKDSALRLPLRTIISNGDSAQGQSSQSGQQKR